jgi:hypothetical protein
MNRKLLPIYYGAVQWWKFVYNCLQLEQLQIGSNSQNVAISAKVMTFKSAWGQVKHRRFQSSWRFTRVIPLFSSLYFRV